MRTFKKALSLFLSLMLLLSMALMAMPASAEQTQTADTAKFTLADGSTTNFSANAESGTIVTDGTGEGYIYFDAGTANGYATSWETTGTITKKRLR